MNTQKCDRLLPLGRFFAVLLVILMVSGCTEFARRFPDLFPKEKTVVIETPAPVVNIPEPEPHFVHIVTWPGESLSVISKWYTGRIANWRPIADANPQLDPNRIFIGDTVVIPEELLITRTDMPEEFMTRFTGHSKPSVPDMDKGSGEGAPPGPAIGDASEDLEVSPPAAGGKKDTGGEDVEGGAVAPAPHDSGESDAFELFGPKE